jgi:hypothetical protein
MPSTMATKKFCEQGRDINYYLELGSDYIFRVYLSYNHPLLFKDLGQSVENQSQRLQSHTSSDDPAICADVMEQHII